MIFDSLGIGEIGVIVAVAVIFVDPKKIGQAGRAFARFRRKWSEIQRQVRHQFDTVMEEGAADKPGGIRSAKAALRLEGRETLRTLPAAERARAAAEITSSLREWSTFQAANVIAVFCGTLEEVDTESLIRQALVDGKTVLLPYVKTNAEGDAILALAPVWNYDRDLSEGAFGILEPKEELRGGDIPKPEMALIPGLLFDESGGRIGRGKGFYDRYLKDCAALKIGLCFEAQVARKKLALEAHDQLLDGLVTERRRLTFSQSRGNATPEESKG